MINRHPSVLGVLTVCAIALAAVLFGLVTGQRPGDRCAPSAVLVPATAGPPVRFTP